ncbi:MAG: hypothetical protein JSW06_09930 [Thermoplasmatales archaeon]|nr:MAG: hypothetical protein JSW06_09930 [Thermoplasmatales archaeon]
MAVSPVDVVIFAPLAPLFGLLLFWFIQLVFIESQKYLLSKIWDRHKPLCRFTNFLGILYQTICHALGYTVTKSGISNFYVSINYGKVVPKKEKKGIFEWMSNSFLFMGPFFIPALLLLICFFLIIGSGVDIAQSIEYTFAEGMINFGTNLYAFSEYLFSFLISIDLLHPAHLGFLILLIFLGMGIRPSYIDREERIKVDMIYDLKNIKSHIMHKPLYLILLFFIAYLFFYVSFLFQQNWYVALFSIFGWLSIIAIVSLLIAHMIILLIKTTDRMATYRKLLLYLTIPISYIFMRIVFFFFLVDFSKSVSLLIMVLSTIVVLFLMLRYKTNKLKTIAKMKQLRVEDDSKRPIRK